MRRLSVVVPNYNYSRYLRERVQSILSQSYPIHELILLDDASTDDSVELMQQLVQEYPNQTIRIHLNDSNSGNVFRQWEAGWSLATGDFVWIAEADDLAKPEFAARLMAKFSDPHVVLAYAESERMDEEGTLTAPHCRDWMTAASRTQWDKAFTMSGSRYVLEYLSAINTLPNVSAVIWKRLADPPNFSMGQSYRLCGDWALYCDYLLRGRIAYEPASLNRFRKHRTSVSKAISSTRRNAEEIDRLIAYVRTLVEVTPNIKLLQNQRLRDEYTAINAAENGKRIAVLMPRPIKGSGGLRTIVAHANNLVRNGYQCDFFFGVAEKNDANAVGRDLVEFYGENLCGIRFGVDREQEYTYAFATHALHTPEHLRYFRAKYRCYLVQDYEPWFEPMGQTYLEMERGYGYGYHTITIGNWLTTKVPFREGQRVGTFPFGVDLSCYRNDEASEREYAVCFIAQPKKPRRGYELGIEALRLLKRRRPGVKIYFYGSEEPLPEVDFDVVDLGLLKPKELARLYQKCRVGLCLSTSNPSRIPFEMMACGLAVVDLWRENNLYDYPDGSVLLADSHPASLATAVDQLLMDESSAGERGQKGYEFVRQFPVELEYARFVDWVKALEAPSGGAQGPAPKLYHSSAVLADANYRELYDDWYFSALAKRPELAEGEASLDPSHSWWLVRLVEYLRTRLPQDTWYFRLLQSVFRNAKQHWNRAQIRFLKGTRRPDYYRRQIDRHSVISFDVFDTLVARRLTEPRHVFRMVERETGRVGFSEEREAADTRLRATLPAGKDLTLDDLYNELKVRMRLSDRQTQELKDSELHWERALTCPRDDVLALLHWAVRSGKKVILISDMYLPQAVVRELLDRVNVPASIPLYLSSETGRRKDTGLGYQHLLSEHPQETLLHLGDNLWSDGEMARRSGLDALPIASADEAMEGYSFGRLGKTLATNSLVWSAAIGTVSRQLFHRDGFSSHGFTTPSVIPSRVKPLDYREFGFSFFGPLLYTFSAFLYEKRADTDCFLFLSREGHFLKRAFELYSSHQGQPSPPSHYYYASRRSALLASLEGQGDPAEFLPRVYRGSLANLLKSVFLLELPGSRRIDLSVPSDRDFVLETIHEHWDEVVRRAAEQREFQREYWNSIVGKASPERVVLVDLGYAGTIQWALSKALGSPLKGAYILVNPTSVRKETAPWLSALMARESSGDSTETLYQWSLLLESFLSAPHGQFSHFTKNGPELQPHFVSEKRRPVAFAELETIMSGVVDYFESMRTFAFTPSEVVKEQTPRLSDYLVEHLTQVRLSGSVQRSFQHFDEFYHRWRNVYESVLLRRKAIEKKAEK